MFCQRAFIVMLAVSGIFITSFIALFVWAYLSNNWRICLFICYLCFDVDKNTRTEKNALLSLSSLTQHTIALFHLFTIELLFQQYLCEQTMAMGAQHELYSLKQRPTLDINTLWWLMEWNYPKRVNLNSLSIKIHIFFY